MNKPTESHRSRQRDRLYLNRPCHRIDLSPTGIGSGPPARAWLKDATCAVLIDGRLLPAEAVDALRHLADVIELTGRALLNHDEYRALRNPADACKTRMFRARQLFVEHAQVILERHRAEDGRNTLGIEDLVHATAKAMSRRAGGMFGCPFTGHRFLSPTGAAMVWIAQHTEAAQQLCEQAGWSSLMQVGAA